MYSLCDYPPDSHLRTCNRCAPVSAAPAQIALHARAESDATTHKCPAPNPEFRSSHPHSLPVQSSCAEKLLRAPQQELAASSRDAMAEAMVPENRAASYTST